MRVARQTRLGQDALREVFARMVAWRLHWAMRGMVDQSLWGRVASDLQVAKDIVTGLMIVEGFWEESPEAQYSLSCRVHTQLMDLHIRIHHERREFTRREAEQSDALNWLCCSLNGDAPWD